MHIVINIIAFKIGWVSTILGAANDMPWLGPAVVAVAIAIHLFNAIYPGDEFLLILSAGFIGAIWDSVMVAAGWLTYPTGTIIAGAAPYWIIGMWMLFATTLNLTFRWLRGKLLIAALLGAVFGPLSYYIGAELGAVTINDFTAAMSALGIAWAAIMPGLMLLAPRLDGFHTNSRAAAKLS